MLGSLILESGKWLILGRNNNPLPVGMDVSENCWNNFSEVIGKKHFNSNI
jgi:hypothetical protein